MSFLRLGKFFLHRFLMSFLRLGKCCSFFIFMFRMRQSKCCSFRLLKLLLRLSKCCLLVPFFFQGHFFSLRHQLLLFLALEVIPHVIHGLSRLIPILLESCFKLLGLPSKFLECLLFGLNSLLEVLKFEIGGRNSFLALQSKLIDLSL